MKRILIVEDEYHVAKEIKDTLNEIDKYFIAIADTYAEAVDMIDEIYPTLFF